MAIGTLLISLCLGYLVFLEASKEKKEVRTFGRTIAIVVITLSLAGLVCGLKTLAAKSGCFPMLKMNCDKSMTGTAQCPISGAFGK